MPLQLQPNLKEPGQRYFREFSAADDFYEMLIEAHRDLDEARSRALNARLIARVTTLIEAVLYVSIATAVMIFSIGLMREEQVRLHAATWPAAASGSILLALVVIVYMTIRVIAGIYSGDKQGAEG